MRDIASSYLNLHVPPEEMVKYIQDLMTLPPAEIAASAALTLAQRHWGVDTPLARAALPPPLVALALPPPCRPTPPAACTTA